MTSLSPRTRRVLAGAAAAAVVAAGTAGYAGRHDLNEAWLKYQWRDRHYNGAVMEKALMIAGGNPTEAQKESKEATTLEEQFAQARTAPGIVAPGAYGAAFSQLSALPHTGGQWQEVTKVPYNADDPRYRDYYSNSSGGAGHVTGRITGLAADSADHVYAAGADGGVWRSSQGGGKWTPIADSLPSLSGGDLELARNDGSLWFATGEANTGGTSYVGAGVYRLANPATGSFTPSDRVGGKELESTTIGRVRWGGSTVFAATNRGIWYHAAGTPSGDWTFGFAPNMSYMPGITDDAGKVLVPAGSNWSGNTASGATDAAYKNIVNDIAVDPRNPKHVVAAIGWRSGDTYNGFYETNDFTQGPSSWHKVTPVKGQIPNTDDIGYTTFAFSKDGSRLYALIQQPSKIAGSSSLMGIFESKQGKVQGPWQKIADASSLRAGGSALGGSYDVGVQAWYNQFLQVDPANPDHVWAGLEEVFETKDAGSHWNAVSPYWNFNFPCWSYQDSKNSCPLAGHPDQHSVAVGTAGGTPVVFFGNDGGIYRRPVNGTVNANGNATDLKSMSEDGTLGALQYYSSSVGKDPSGVGVVVSGGLQDNGVSNLRKVAPDATNGDTEMGSNFGGDGGDGAADPRDGCNQLQEYTNLAVYVTNNCATNPNSTVNQGTATSWSLDPGDPNARFIAPIGLDGAKPDNAIFGGQYVYTATDVWKARDSSALKKQFDLGAGHSATAVAMENGTAYVSWCGPCNNAGFTRGIATNAGGTWHQLTLDSSFPNRFVQGLAVDPADGNHAYAAINGFSRRFTEGPGAGVGHVYETTDGGEHWTDISGNLPDVPASSVKRLSNGALVLGTDLTTFYRAPGATSWQVLGTGQPTTVVMDLEVAPDGDLYAATHGRGMWSIPLP